MRIISLAAQSLLLIFATASAADACSKRGLYAFLRADGAFFTGIAATDTLLAGPGAVSYGLGGGHYGRGDDRPIYGQLVRVDRIGGPAARQLDPNVQEVVVVPWDYDASCRTLAWGNTAQWVSPDTHGFYIANLRAPEHWVEGKPTFDVHNPGHMPYTGAASESSRTGSDRLAAPALSPEQLFDFYRALPAQAEVDALKSRALGSLRTWVEANGDLVSRPPLPVLLSEVRSVVVRAELKEVRHPVLGTWRFTVRAGGDSMGTFYARTESYPTSRWNLSRADRGDSSDPLHVGPAEGYVFLAAVFQELEDAPRPDRTRRYDHYNLYATAEPETTGKGEARWRGWVTAELLQLGIPGNPLVERAAGEGMARFRSRYRQRLPHEAPAIFTRGVDGVLRVTQTFPVSDAEDLILEGVQVSSNVMEMPD